MAECGVRSGRARPSALDARLELLHLFVGQFDGADERFALAEAVAIGAAGHEQVMPVGNFKIALGHCGRVLRMKTLDAVQSRGHQQGNDIVRTVQAGMGHDREAAITFTEISPS